MISESRYWKDDLLRLAEQLRRARHSTARLTPRRYVNIEKAALLGAFTLRRLCDSHKVSERTSHIRLRVLRFPNAGKHVTWANCHKVDELFDLSKAKREEQPLLFLCNQAIHSYVLAPYTDRNAKHTVGLLMASDHQRNKALFGVPLAEFERAFRRAARDYPTYTLGVFDKKLGDFRIRAL